MEFINQSVVFLMRYFGKNAQCVLMLIGVVLAILAVYVCRRVFKKIKVRVTATRKKDTEVKEVSKQGEKLEQHDVDSNLVVGTSLESAMLSVNEQASSVEEAVTMSFIGSADREEAQILQHSWSKRINFGLFQTRNRLGNCLSSILTGSKKVDDDLLEELETQLLGADVGIDATKSLMDGLTEKLSRKELKDSSALLDSLKEEMTNILISSQKYLNPTKKCGPFVVLMVGVNGVGKTTTIGKLTKKYQAEGKSVILAAGDTFRAAATEQLQVWAERNNVPMVAQPSGADSASVIYDAIESAKAKGIDIVIADTAGRLQNKVNLMNELSKVVRVMKKLDLEAPHEVMLVLDAGTGQNALSQAKLFTEAIGVSGITLTKLDGTAKGGIIFAIVKQFNLPIRYIGVGEQINDLRLFLAKEFVDALFDSE